MGLPIVAAKMTFANEETEKQRRFCRFRLAVAFHGNHYGETKVGPFLFHRNDSRETFSLR